MSIRQRRGNDKGGKMEVRDKFFFFKQKTAYELSACLVGSEMFIIDRRISIYLETR